MTTATILVIDDDPDFLLANRMTLEAAGYNVIEARSGAEGLEKVRAEAPDLIILDVMMESATAGFQTALKLRSRDPQSEYAAYRHIPIIMLTAVHETAPVRLGPDEDYLPVEAFIDKPVDPDRLLAKVEALLATPKA